MQKSQKFLLAGALLAASSVSTLAVGVVPTDIVQIISDVTATFDAVKVPILAVTIFFLALWFVAKIRKAR